MTTPYLSIVMASRNDEYVPGTRHRLQVAINSLIEQLEQYQLESELILVEWNPPPNSPNLMDTLAWPNRTDYCTIRMIQVPPFAHRRFRISHQLPFLVHAARNVGIRQARGKFVLPTATDLLFSDALVQFLASKRLRADGMYRVDRYDVPERVIKLPSLEARLAFCDWEPNIVDIHRQEETPLHTNACGDFTLLSRELWFRVHGFPEEDKFSGVRFDGVLCYMAHAAGAKEEVLLDPMRIYHMGHESVWKPKETRISTVLDTRPILGLLSHLPRGIARKGISVTRKIMGTQSRFERLGIPVIERSDYLTMAMEIMRGQRSFVYNDDSWGLKEYKLNGTVVTRASWDRG